MVKAGLGDGTGVIEVAVDGSNDNPNSCCNFPRIDNCSDEPVAIDLLQCPFFCFTNLTPEMPAGKKKKQKPTPRTVSSRLRKMLATCNTTRQQAEGIRNRPL